MTEIICLELTKAIVIAQGSIRMGVTIWKQLDISEKVEVTGRS